MLVALVDPRHQRNWYLFITRRGLADGPGAASACMLLLQEYVRALIHYDGCFVPCKGGACYAAVARSQFVDGEIRWVNHSSTLMRILPEVPSSHYTFLLIVKRNVTRCHSFLVNFTSFAHECPLLGDTDMARNKRSPLCDS